LGVGKSGDWLIVAKPWFKLEGEDSGWVIEKEKEEGGWEKCIKDWRIFRARLVVVSGDELVGTNTGTKSEMEDLGWVIEKEYEEMGTGE